MSHEISTFSVSIETSLDSRDTRLFAVLLSNRADRGPTGSKSRAMVNVCVKVWVNVMIDVIVDVIVDVNSKKLLWIFW